jgi:rhodanese-related sulfurtransferase
MMESIVGFTIAKGIGQDSWSKALNAQNKALIYFAWLKRISLNVGDTKVELWGHGDFKGCLHQMLDGAVLILIGSPIGKFSWQNIEEQLTRIAHMEDFDLSLDGRFILLKISADGKHWTMWNDWVGSIPLFHASVGQGRIASTLEPVVVATAGYTSNDFFLPGLVSLLINGHYLGEWTLFKEMQIVPADCYAHWNADGFNWKRLWTVKPTQERWEKGWDETIEEMHNLTHKIILDTLKTSQSWILPLSGGLDSRLMAAIASEEGFRVYAYTYGHKYWNEAIYARQVAEALDIPWQRTDLGTDYLNKYTILLADWFGSGTNLHGMYQMPFLMVFKDGPPGKILSGYMGDPLAGNHITTLIRTHSGFSKLRPVTETDYRWKSDEIKQLVKFPIQESLDEYTYKLEAEIEQVPGVWFQKLMFLDFWNRQRLHIFYQPTMYDYWRGAAAPFLNRTYANFLMSLPRIVLEKRRLQLEMLRFYFPLLAQIGGTFGFMPLRATKWWLMRQKIACILPKRLNLGPLREFNSIPNTFELDCVRKNRMAAYPLLKEAWQIMSEWFNMDFVEKTIEEIIKGEGNTCKIDSLQTVAYRILNERK